LSTAYAPPPSSTLLKTCEERHAFREVGLNNLNAVRPIA
jgi:hypothetical protein